MAFYSEIPKICHNMTFMAFDGLYPWHNLTFWKFTVFKKMATILKQFESIEKVIKTETLEINESLKKIKIQQIAATFKKHNKKIAAILKHFKIHQDSKTL